MAKLFRCALPFLVLMQFGCSSESSAEPLECAAIRRGVELCEGPEEAAAVSCEMPAEVLRCAAEAPSRESEGACRTFLGCLYDGPS